MPKFRKKPVVIEAVQFTEDLAWASFLEQKYIFGRLSVSGSYQPDMHEIYHAWVTIETLEGQMRAELGDWIIKGVKGEFYPIKDSIFRETYEPVED